MLDFRGTDLKLQCIQLLSNGFKFDTTSAVHWLMSQGMCYSNHCCLWKEKKKSLQT